MPVKQIYYVLQKYNNTVFSRLNTDFLEILLQRLQEIERRYVYIFFIVFVLNIMAYGLIVGELIYTNHTFPSAWPQSFPSFRSQEGRWAHDLIYLFQGGSGIAFFQTVIAISIQILTGMLFAVALNRKDNTGLIVSASIVSLIPYVNDYYGFPGDSIMFAVGDLLAVTGVLIPRKSIKHVLASAFVFQLSIACYQPKVATICVVSAVYSLFLLADWDGGRENLKAILKSIMLLVAAVLAGAGMYLLVLKSLYIFDLIPSGQHFARRLSVASLDQIAQNIKFVITDIYNRLFIPETLIPQYVKHIAAVVSFISICISILSITILKTARYHKIAVLIAIVIALIFSLFSVDIAFIISPNSYWYSGSGRFRTTFGFLVAAMMIIAIKAGRNNYNNIALIAVAIMIHSYIITNASIGQQARLKNIAEFAYVSRILSRIESQPGFDYDKKYRIAIFGYFPLFMVRQYAEMPTDTVVSNLTNTSFIRYRQAEMLNWFAGKQAFEVVTREQFDQVETYASTHDPYPSGDSVKLFEDGLIVVILEKYYPGMAYTRLE